MWTTAAAYVALSIALIEVVDAVSEALLFPDWTQRLVTFLLILGFPLAVVLAWIFDIGPGVSVTRTPGEGDEPGSPDGQPRGQSRESATGGSRAPAVPRSRGALRRNVPTLPETPALPRAPGPPPTAAASEAPPDPDRVRRAALAHVRHELRTPINAILGYSELMLEEDPGPELEADLRKIRAAGSTLLGIVDRILNPAQLAGAIERELESYAEEVRVELRTPVNSVIGYAEMLLESEREGGRDAFLADLERIHTAAVTLLAHSDDIVAVALAVPGAEGGAGRAAPALGASTQMAQGVLEGMAAAPASSARGPEGAGTLLVVDDNDTGRDLLARQLAGYGYIVDTATNGEEALERLASTRCDLVLLDVIMPVMDGVETLRRLKADPALRTVPVVMLSSLDETDAALRCLEMGAEEYLSKPVPSRLLQARIESNLLLRRLREHGRLLEERVREDAALLERFLGDAFPPAAAAALSAGTAYRQSIPQTTVLICRLDPRDAPPGRGTPAEHLAAFGALCAAGEAQASALGLEAHAAHRDAFVVAVSGSDDAPGEPAALADLAVALLDPIPTPGAGGGAWPVRAALHQGAAVAGVVGERRPRFDVWGEAVDTALALAAQAEPGSALVSPTAQSLLDGSHPFEAVGVREVQGRGRMRLHALRPAAP